MTIALSDGLITVTLPDDMDWTDEFSYSPIVQSVNESVTGASILQIGVKQAGRPITLRGTTERAWIKLPIVQQLYSWSRVAGQTMTLSLRGTARQVVFRHHESPALEAQEIWGEVPILASQEMAVTLKLMEI